MLVSGQQMSGPRVEDGGYYSRTHFPWFSWPFIQGSAEGRKAGQGGDGGITEVGWGLDKAIEEAFGGVLVGLGGALMWHEQGLCHQKTHYFFPCKVFHKVHFLGQLDFM